MYKQWSYAKKRIRDYHLAQCEIVLDTDKHLMQSLNLCINAVVVLQDYADTDAAIKNLEHSITSIIQLRNNLYKQFRYHAKFTKRILYITRS